MRRTLSVSVSLLLIASTVGVHAAIVPVQQKPYPETSQRGNARVFYWGERGSVGQFAIDYGQPVWKDSYEDAIDKMTGVRWRFGQNFWTTLDTNIALTIGGVSVPAGYHYLIAERKADGKFVLIALDPVAVRERKLDAFEAAKTTGGIEIPLTHEETESSAQRLKIELKLDAAAKHEASLVVQFGPHQLSALVVMHPN